MKRMCVLGFFLLALSSLTGCLSFRRPGDQTVLPSYVGERSTAALGTVTAPVALASGHERYVNLTVMLAVLINTEATALLTDTSDVRGIVARHQPRIAARVVETVTGTVLNTPADLASIRATIAGEAQAELDAVLRSWADAGKYRVRLVVTGLSLASPNAAPPAPARFMW